MPDIRRDTGSALDIVQRELGHARVELEEERQRLADTTAGTEDGDLGCLHRHIISECNFDLPMDGRVLTLAAVAEKALRWAAAAPKTERDAWRAANMVVVWKTIE